MLFEEINKELRTFYKKDEDINWNDISKYRELSENFIEKFKDYIDWNEISRHQILSEDFIEKHKDNLEWGSISSNQILSEDFIKRNEDYVDWEKLSCNPSLLFSKDFMIDKLNWNTVSLLQPFIDSNWDYVNKN